MATMTRTPLLPFRQNTRQRIQPVAVVPFALATRTSIELPRVGFLAGILIEANIQYTNTAPSVLTAKGPWTLFQRMTMNLNVGAATVFDLSGYGAYILNHDMINPSYDPTSTALFAWPTAAGAQQGAMSFYIPVATDDGNEFSSGLINLQAPEIRCSLDLQFCNALTDIGTNITPLAGNVTISYVYYEVPDPTKVLYPPLMLHRILEDRQTITAVGDQVYTVPRQGTLLQLAHAVTLNSLNVYPSTGAMAAPLVTQFVLRINKTDNVYRMDAQTVNHYLALLKRTGNTLSAFPLAFMWNFFAAQGLNGYGDTRDTIDSEAVSTLESVITVASGAVIGTAYVDNIRRIVQVLQI